MNDLMNAIKFLGVPATVGIALVALFLVLNIIGEIAECFGKVVPEFIKVRKYFQRRRTEKQETAKTLQSLKDLLDLHCSATNIEKRNAWMANVDKDMAWTHNRADYYDKTITEIKETLADASNALRANTRMTEDMFVENSRDRIMDFAEKASNYGSILSHEQFRRIFKVYECYEKFLEDHGMTNGEVDIAYEMIQDGFKYRMKNQCFAEDIKGYPKKEI